MTGLRFFLRTAAVILLAATVGTVRIPAQTSCTGEAVGSIVRTGYIHGFPDAELIALGCEDLAEVWKELYEIRHSRAESQYWLNAIIAEGVLGHVSVWPQLREFLHADNRDWYQGRLLPIEFYDAKMSVLRTLGMLLNHADGQAAPGILKYLEDGVRPGAWDTRTTWTSTYDDTPTERNLQLAEECVRALGFSGHHQAVHYLIDLEVALRRVDFPEGKVPVLPDFLLHAGWGPSDITPEIRDALVSATEESIRVGQSVRSSRSFEEYLVNPN